jgi:hypothetical protein
MKVLFDILPDKTKWSEICQEYWPGPLCQQRHFQIERRQQSERKHAGPELRSPAQTFAAVVSTATTTMWLSLCLALGVAIVCRNNARHRRMPYILAYESSSLVIVVVVAGHGPQLPTYIRPPLATPKSSNRSENRETSGWSVGRFVRRETRRGGSDRRSFAERSCTCFDLSRPRLQRRQRQQIARSVLNS